MYQSINKSEFHSAFHRMDRGTQFSYDALNLIINYFEEREEGGTPVELDVIAICCDFAESTYEEIASGYSIEDLKDLSI